MATTNEFHSTHSVTWSVRAIFGFLVLGVVVLLSYAYTYGSAARASANRAEALMIQSENETFCTGLGLAPKTESYARCVAGLTEIRRRQQQRFNDDTMGIL